MLVAIDIGNTTVNIGLFNGAKLIETRKIITKRSDSKIYYLIQLKRLLRHKKIEGAIIASVVPNATNAFRAIFKRHFHLKPIILGEDLIVPIKNLYKNPKQVGQDRLVNAYAGYKKFGGSLIIVDFGTAITFDVVSKRGEYLGGIIVPGLEISLSALTEKTALLPRVSIRRTRTLIGRDTVSSMLSGILYGYGALCDGLIKLIKNEAGARYKVILTGGHAKLISNYCRFNPPRRNPRGLPPTAASPGIGFRSCEIHAAVGISASGRELRPLGRRGSTFVVPNLTLEGLSFIYKGANEGPPRPSLSRRGLR